MAKKRCPTCGRIYEGLEKYCTKCGIELMKVGNQCSAMKTELCKHRVFEDDDVFCCYCGALTTYALEKQK